ncbi:antibiotic biosynthesis monooxygenase [Halobellus sp. Atlit-31R]|nr:antibiotic biosynthesis monooxygenase [Halobellus sp. Atlit-31R]
MLVVHAYFPIDPDRRSEALDLVETMVERSNQEPGALEYRATADLRDENTIRFIERYEDAEAFEAHTQTDHYRELQAALPELLAGEPDTTRYEIGNVTAVDV